MSTDDTKSPNDGTNVPSTEGVTEPLLVVTPNTPDNRSEHLQPVGSRSDCHDAVSDSVFTTTPTDTSTPSPDEASCDGPSGSGSPSVSQTRQSSEEKETLSVESAYTLPGKRTHKRSTSDEGGYMNGGTRSQNGDHHCDHHSEHHHHHHLNGHSSHSSNPLHKHHHLHKSHDLHKCSSEHHKSHHSVYSEASSRNKGRIKMEEVAPSSSSIVNRRVNPKSITSNSTNKNDGDWRVSLSMFSSRRRGKQDADKGLPRSVRRYYKTQDELITAYEELRLDIDDAMEQAEEHIKLQRRADILAKVSFVCNLLLLIGKAVAAGLSGSLAVISSVIDSAVDLVSGGLMWWSGRAITNRNIYRYPQGRTKLEPVAIIILAVVMSLASVQMIRESVEQIIYFATVESKGPDFGIASITICCITIVMKLILFLVCRPVRTPSTDALAQDHRNDVLSNTVALACGLIGDKLWSYADPIGAIIISIYIMVSWFLTGKEQIKMLTGHTARPDFLKKITWLALNHDSRVLLIDTVRAFHFGSNFLVEVDIVLPEEMSMRVAHDIGETLQLKIERLKEVERAFVHLDYETDHSPFSEHKQV